MIRTPRKTNEDRSRILAKWILSLLLYLLLGTIGLALNSVDGQEPLHSYKPPKGFVPDSLTAVRVAEAVLVPVYGQAVIDDEKPLRAVLKGGVWTVRGHIKGGPGGVSHVEIAKADARILRMTHGR
jgi:hypothetical protein